MDYERGNGGRKQREKLPVSTCTHHWQPKQLQIMRAGDQRATSELVTTSKGCAFSHAWGYYRRHACDNAIGGCCRGFAARTCTKGRGPDAPRRTARGAELSFDAADGVLLSFDKASKKLSYRGRRIEAQLIESSTLREGLRTYCTRLVHI